MDGVPREASYDILAFFACSRWRLFGFCFLFFWIGFSFFGGEGELVVICDERGGVSRTRVVWMLLGPRIDLRNGPEHIFKLPVYKHARLK